MIYAVAIACPPAAAAVLFLGNLFDKGVGSTVSSILDLAALTVLVAGFFVVSRLQLALKAAEATSSAWKSERDAAVSHADRLSTQLGISEDRVKLLESRPTLDILVSSLDRMSSAIEVHETQAASRGADIIAAIDQLKEVTRGTGTT